MMHYLAYEKGIQIWAFWNLIFLRKVHISTSISPLLLGTIFGNLKMADIWNYVHLVLTSCDFMNIYSPLLIGTLFGYLEMADIWNYVHLVLTSCGFMNIYFVYAIVAN